MDINKMTYEEFEISLENLKKSLKSEEISDKQDIKKIYYCGVVDAISLVMELINSDIPDNDKVNKINEILNYCIKIFEIK